jgi:hypothetical protein
LSTRREAWLCVLQDADGNEETELVTIEWNGDGAPPLIELTNGIRVTCTQPARATTTEARRRRRRDRLDFKRR